jgi:hypothetical protein
MNQQNRSIREVQQRVRDNDIIFVFFCLRKPTGETPTSIFFIFGKGKKITFYKAASLKKKGKISGASQPKEDLLIKKKNFSRSCVLTIR